MTMNVITKILPRFAILEIFFEDTDSYGAELATYSFDGFTTKPLLRFDNAGIDHIEKEAKGLPLFIAYGGFGIISKEAETNPEIIEKVKNDVDNFVWTESVGQIIFLRRERTDEVFEKYELNKNIPLAVFCFSSKTHLSLQIEALGRSEFFYKYMVNLTMLLKPSLTGSVLCRLIVSRLKLPIIIILFLMLVVNIFADKNIRVKYNNLQAQLEPFERKQGKGNEVALKTKQMFAELNRKPQFEYSWLCDIVGIVLPEGITLSSIVIQPLHKALESGVKPELEHDKMIIKGVSKQAEDITNYTIALGEFIQLDNIQLTSVNRARDSDGLDFSILIDLL